jgi:hypothetical protein
MEGFNDFIFIIASENESAVFGELLNRRSQEELYIGSGIVCFINDDDFVFRVTRKRDCRCEVLGVSPNSVKKPALIRSINDIIVHS